MHTHTHKQATHTHTHTHTHTPYGMHLSMYCRIYRMSLRLYSLGKPAKKQKKITWFVPRWLQHALRYGWQKFPSVLSDEVHGAFLCARRFTSLLLSGRNSFFKARLIVCVILCDMRERERERERERVGCDPVECLLILSLLLFIAVSIYCVL